MLRRFRDVEVLIVTIKRVWKPLLLPMFFLMIFSFVFGSLLFLLDPCFDYNTCAFSDVTTSSYFVIVTMTTVGYGDQIPTKIAAMLLTSLMMLFGRMPPTLAHTFHCTPSTTTPMPPTIQKP